MKGRDIIKAIIDADGLDTEYNFTPVAKKKPGKKKSEPLTRFEVDAENGLVSMYVSDPLKAFSTLKLNDEFKKYTWDGDTLYFYAEPDSKSAWRISFGNGSTTCVTSNVVKYRDAACKLMIEAAFNEFKKGNPIPEWMKWRVNHFMAGKPGLNVLE